MVESDHLGCACGWLEERMGTREGRSGCPNTGHSRMGFQAVRSGCNAIWLKVSLGSCDRTRKSTHSRMLLSDGCATINGGGFF